MDTKELPEAQIDRQDVVDNAIYNLLLELSGKTEDELEQDMEHIGDIRDVVQEVICDRLKIMSPMDFYPWIKSCGNCDCFDQTFKQGGVCRIDGGDDDAQCADVACEGCCDRWKNDKEAWTIKS